MLKALLYISGLICAYLVCAYVPFGFVIVIGLMTYHNHSLRMEREKRDDEVESLHEKIHDLTDPDWCSR